MVQRRGKPFPVEWPVGPVLFASYLLFFATNQTAERSSSMNMQPRLLAHPFYQAWSRGEVPIQVLAQYQVAYAEFIRRIPKYWETVIAAFQPDAVQGHPVVRDEQDHVQLWELWGAHLPGAKNAPTMQEVLTAFEGMTPSQLLGAIQAFEIQQPEVARTKKEGLLKHYGFSEQSLQYFDAHCNEEKHVAYGHFLATQFADHNEYEEGFSTGSRLIYHSLDPFVALLRKSVCESSEVQYPQS
jgi:pyrroloquinoline-quinone synthase